MNNPAKHHPDPAPSEVLPAPYADPLGDRVQPSPAVRALVQSQVGALLASSPSYHQMSEAERRRLAADLEKIAAYSATLVQEDWQQSLALGQTPLVREQRVVEAAGRRAPARTAEDGPDADEFSPRAASQVARITEETLNAIAFPTFVADLVKGTFQAVVDASIQQMEAYGELLANVAKTVDEFMGDNITDNQARDWLAGAYPQQVRLNTAGGEPRLEVRPDADVEPPASLQRDLNLPPDVTLDDESVERVLVPAARRRIAQSRQQVLATMVLMGINRIVVTSGKIRASMGFRIDAKDRARAESASEFDFRHEQQARYSWLFSPVKVSSKTTVAYVSSTKKDSEDEINVEADLTGEVELRFKSETFPLERFADAGVISDIQSNTAVPGANTPITGGGGAAGDG